MTSFLPRTTHAALALSLGLGCHGGRAERADGPDGASAPGCDVSTDDAARQTLAVALKAAKAPETWISMVARDGVVRSTEVPGIVGFVWRGADGPRGSQGVIYRCAFYGFDSDDPAVGLAGLPERVTADLGWKEAPADRRVAIARTFAAIHYAFLEGRIVTAARDGGIEPRAPRAVSAPSGVSLPDGGVLLDHWVAYSQETVAGPRSVWRHDQLTFGNDGGMSSKELARLQFP